VTVLRGERATLRPFRPDELDFMLRHWRTGVSRERLAERIERSGRFADGILELAIEADGRLVGDIQARAPERAMPKGVAEIGITLYRTDDRGRGIGREAVALFTQHLFDAQLIERVQGSTDVENHAMRRVFELLGFREEGVMRGFMPERGRRADYVLYAVLRDEWRGLSPPVSR
jgi:RimJ/RimL family protein N-acetyltransferase